MSKLALPHTTRTRTHRPRWRAKFLAALRKAPSVKHACMVAHVSRRTVYDLREGDQQFADEWKAAIQASVDELEHVAFQRALAGDSNLITFMLRCHKPEVYRETQRVDVGLLGGIVLIPSKSEGKE